MLAHASLSPWRCFGASAVHCAAVLNLAFPSDPRWLESALAHLDDVLLDHAHCERKAAGAALNMLFRYPDHAFLQLPVSALARDELEHYEVVLRELAARDVAFTRQRPSPYGGKLHALIRAKEPERLLDLLLVSALIEARSCERFQLLAEAIPDERLAALYRGLLASEARHHGIYLELADELCPRERVRERLRELAEAESAILTEPCRFVRLHTGPWDPEASQRKPEDGRPRSDRSVKDTVQ